DKFKKIYSEENINRLQEFVHNQLMQELANNPSLLNKNNGHYFVNGKEILYELLFPRGLTLETEQLQKYVFDSTLILEKVHTIDGFIEALSSPVVQARLQRIQYLIKMNSNDKSFRKYKYILEKE